MNAIAPLKTALLPQEPDDAASRAYVDALVSTASPLPELDELRAEVRRLAARLHEYETGVRAPVVTPLLNVQDPEIHQVYSFPYFVPITWLELSGGATTAGVSTFNGRAGNVVLTAADVIAALGYTPANAATVAAMLVVGDTPPAAPPANSFWFDSISAQLFYRYDDGTSVQWVVANHGP